MAPPAEKKKKLSSSADHRFISSATFSEYEQQSLGSFETAVGGRRSVRVANKMNNQISRKIWISNAIWTDILPFFDPAQLGLKMALLSPRFNALVNKELSAFFTDRKGRVCNDIWMDIFPFFRRPQLGLQMALLSDRFDCLVDTQFDGKTELTIWRTIRKRGGSNAKLSVQIGGKFVRFPFPDRPLRDNIRFKDLRIEYIDHDVITFFRANRQIWDSGTILGISVNPYNTPAHCQPILDVLVREIWPIFATSKIHRLELPNATHLDALLRHTSPTIFFNLNINSIDSGGLCPAAVIDVISDFDVPNAAIFSAGQVLTKWLHTPRKDGQPKRLRFNYLLNQPNLEWINNFKKIFLCATASVSYTIQFKLFEPAEPFELVNERTNEKLTLKEKPHDDDDYLLLKRCPISETAATDQWENDENSDDNLSNVRFNLRGGRSCSIGPLSPSKRRKRSI